MAITRRSLLGMLAVVAAAPVIIHRPQQVEDVESLLTCYVDNVPHYMPLHGALRDDYPGIQDVRIVDSTVHFSQQLTVIADAA